MKHEAVLRGSSRPSPAGVEHPCRDAQAIQEPGLGRGATHNELKLERQSPTEMARPVLRRNPAGIPLVEEPSR